MNCLVNKFIFVVPDMPDKIRTAYHTAIKGFLCQRNVPIQNHATLSDDMRTLEHHQVLRHEQFQLKQRNGVIH